MEKSKECCKKCYQSKISCAFRFCPCHTPVTESEECHICHGNKEVQKYCSRCLIPPLLEEKDLVDWGEEIKMIICLPFLNPPLDNIKASELKKVWDWQELQIKNLLSSNTERVKKDLENKLGDFAHEQYLGCHTENGIWHYSYRNEVCNIIKEFFNKE